MTAVERKLRALVKAVLDECDENPGFRERLETILGSAEVERQRTSTPRTVNAQTDSHGRASAAGKPGVKRIGRRPSGPFDPFAVFQAGEERDPLESERRDGGGGEADLRRRLATIDEEALKDIIAEHSMDPARLAMKWKDPTRLIDLIVKVVVQRRRKGEAFMTPEFRVRVSDAVYVNEWSAVIVGVEISNRGEADTIVSISLRIGDNVYTNSTPDPSKSIPKLIGEIPRRLDQNDGVEGALYFGPSAESATSIGKAAEGELIVRRASGGTQRAQFPIRSRGDGTRSSPNDG